jgi:enterochelin esterase-like enzyme
MHNHGAEALKSFKSLGITKHFALPLVVISLASFDSKAQITHGKLERISVHGKALEGNLSGESTTRAVFVYLPASYSRDPARRYPVLYLLHGASALGHKLWSGSLANIEDIADRTMAASTVREMIIVMPDASSLYLGTLYSNSATDGKWEDYILSCNRFRIPPVNGEYPPAAAHTRDGGQTAKRFTSSRTGK